MLSVGKLEGALEGLNFDGRSQEVSWLLCFFKPYFSGTFRFFLGFSVLLLFFPEFSRVFLVILNFWPFYLKPFGEFSASKSPIPPGFIGHQGAWRFGRGWGFLCS